MFFSLGLEGVNSRFPATNILPPISDQWSMPIFHQPRAYWGGQRLGDTYARLAPDVPPRYSNPVMATAQDKLGQALVDGVRYYDSHGYPAQNEPQFVAFIRADLKSKADQVRAMVGRNPY